MSAKKIAIVLLVCFSAGLVFGQNAKVLEFEVGYLNPKDVEGGMIYSGKYGIVVDERVDLSLGLDFFHSSYTQESTVGDEVVVNGQVTSTTKQLELEQSAYLLPISLNATVRFPVQPPLNVFAGAGFSYQMLFNKINNLEDDVSKTLTFRGTGWIFRGGVEYNLGSKSSLLLELFYDLATVSRDLGESELGLPTYDEVDLGGIGFRAGLKMEIY